MSRLVFTGDSIKKKLSESIKEEEKEEVKLEPSSKNEQDETAKKKRTFYLSQYSNDKLNKLHAKMVIQGNKGSISEIIEKAIDKLYETEMSAHVKNWGLR